MLHWPTMLQWPTMMMAKLDLVESLGGTGSRATQYPGFDWLIILPFSIAAVGLAVLLAIAFSNWRAARVLRQLREQAAAGGTSRLRLLGEADLRPRRRRSDRPSASRE